MRRERDIAAKVERAFSVKASRKELERRRDVVMRTLRVRDEIGPIKTKAADLVRGVREGR